MELVTVFEVGQNDYRALPLMFIGSVLVAVGVILVLLRHCLDSKLPKWFPYIFLGGSVYLMFSTSSTTHARSASLAATLRDGRCEIIDGIVSDFHPMNYSGHEEEWFVVDGKRFEYSDYIVSPGFNNTASHGGPIRKGIRVRVHYRGNDIAKLEVAH